MKLSSFQFSPHALRVRLAFHRKSLSFDAPLQEFAFAANAEVNA